MYVSKNFSTTMKQEDRGGPITLTWANRFAYLILKFHTSILPRVFLYKSYSQEWHDGPIKM